MDNSQEHIDRAGMDSAAVEEAAGPQLFKTLQKSASFFSRTNNDSSENSSSKLSASGLSTWAKSFRMPSTFPKENSQPSSKSTFSLLGGGFGKKVSPAKIPVVDAAANETPSVSAAVSANNEGAFETLTKGFLDTSRNAVKAVQLRARHLVSQNKRRYQEDGFDLDLSYITENIIAMGFPAGDMSSGLLGYVEGFYRNHMEEVLKFFETHHKGKYKVYNLCSERLYDVSLLEGKVASFPFDDHNCPPLQLVLAFCLSAYDWLKGDLENVVVVHCKAGKARTGLMISSLLLYLKFFPSAEESIGHYNQRRCVDGKGLILPSQLRYVKYFERILNDFNGETPTGRKCILRGIRLHKCPYWIRPAITVSDHNGVLFTTKKHPRTKDMMPEDFWFSAPRKGVMVFALPGERCVADLNGDFKVHFHDRHGDFYCWLNTNMMEQRQIFNTSELDGFEKRKMPSPNFQVEIVVMDQTVLPPSPSPQSNPTATVATTPIATPTAAATATAAAATATAAAATTAHDDDGATANGDDIFSDSDDGEEEKKISFTAQSPLHEIQSSTETALPVENEGDATATSAVTTVAAATGEKDKEEVSTAEVTEEEASDYVEISTASQQQQQKKSTADDLPTSDFKAMGADASVFTFGDDEDYDDSDE